MCCTFPARELLRFRRQLVERARLTHDPAFIHNAADFVRGTDIVRLAHFDTSGGCLCWYEVIKAEAEAAGIEGSARIKERTHFGPWDARGAIAGGRVNPPARR